MSTLWEETDSFANQYKCDLDMYLMTVLSSSYGIIMDCEINAPGHVKNVVDRLNATENPYLKG